MKSRVQKFESAVEVADQYSRRNCLRVSGIDEKFRNNTDDIILKMVGDIGADLDLDKLVRSHRVGKPKAATSRDIIVKLSTFRVRQSKKISNDQELIQSDPISCPQNQKGNN